MFFQLLAIVIVVFLFDGRVDGMILAQQHAQTSTHIFHRPAIIPQHRNYPKNYPRIFAASREDFPKSFQKSPKKRPSLSDKRRKKSTSLPPLNRLCKDIEAIMEPLVDITVLEPDLARRPDALKCLDMSLAGDIYGSARSILSAWNPTNKTKRYVKFVADFIERAALAGKLNLLELALKNCNSFGSDDSPFDRQQLMYVGQLALEAEQFAAAAVLKRFGVPVDATRIFRSILLDRGDDEIYRAVYLVDIGLISTDDVYALMGKFEGDQYELTPNQMYALRSIIAQILERKHSTINGDRGGVEEAEKYFENFSRFSQTVDPMLYACQTGDILLLRYLGSINSPKSANHLSVLAPDHRSVGWTNMDFWDLFRAQKRLVIESILGNGVRLPDGDLKYLTAAIEGGHNDVVRWLLKAFSFTPATMKAASDLAKLKGNSVGTAVLARFQLTFGEYQLHRFLRSSTFAVVDGLIATATGDSHVLTVPPLAYLDAVRNPSQVEQVKLVEEALIRNGVDPKQFGGYEALEYLTGESGGEHEVSLRIFLAIFDRMPALSPVQITRLAQRMIDFEQWRMLFRVLDRFAAKGLDLQLLISYNRQPLIESLSAKRTADDRRMIEFLGQFE